MEKKINDKSSIINLSNKTASPVIKSRSVVKSENAKPPRVTVIEQKRKSKTPIPVGVVFTIVFITLLFVFLIMNYAEIDSYNSSIAELKDELTELQKTTDKLEQKLEKKNDLVYIEEYATEKLGMVKASGLTRINITSLPESKGYTYRYDDDEKSGIGLLLSGFGEIFGNFFD